MPARSDRNRLGTTLQALHPGTTALAIELDGVDISALTSALEEFGATVLY
jgi:hypothetical protein